MTETVSTTFINSHGEVLNKYDIGDEKEPLLSITTEYYDHLADYFAKEDGYAYSVEKKSLFKKGIDSNGYFYISKITFKQFRIGLYGSISDFVHYESELLGMDAASPSWDSFKLGGAMDGSEKDSIISYIIRNGLLSDDTSYVEQCAKFWANGEDYLSCYGIEPIPRIHPAIKVALENLTGNKEENFTYLMKWLAWKLENPSEAMLSAINIYGGGGSGKGLFSEEILPKLFQQSVISKSDVGGLRNFNQGLRDKCLVIFDECCKSMVGHAESESIKRLVGSTTMRIRGHGEGEKTEKNSISCIFFTNSNLGTFELDRDDDPNGVNRRYSVIKTGIPLATRVANGISDGSLSYYESYDEYLQKLLDVLNNKSVMADLACWIIANYKTEFIPKAHHGEDFKELRDASKNFKHIAFEFFSKFARVPEAVVREVFLALGKKNAESSKINNTRTVKAVIINYCDDNKLRTVKFDYYKNGGNRGLAPAIVFGGERDLWEEFNAANPDRIKIGDDNKKKAAALTEYCVDIITSSKQDYEQDGEREEPDLHPE